MDLEYELELSGSGKYSMMDCCEHSAESSQCIQERKFLTGWMAITYAIGMIFQEDSHICTVYKDKSVFSKLTENDY